MSRHHPRDAMRTYTYTVLYIAVFVTAIFILLLIKL